jgi:hypothetical protein
MMLSSNKRERNTAADDCLTTAMLMYQHGLKISDSLANIALSGKSKPDLPPISGCRERSSHWSIGSMTTDGVVQKLRMGSVDYGHKAMARSGGEIRQPW